MIDRPRTPESETFYDVTLGHSRVRVMGHSLEEALQQARRALSVEMPRLYDVIHHLDAARFQIEAVISPGK